MLSDPLDMRKKNKFFVFRNFHFYAFYRHFSNFPYRTLVFFCFQVTGHSYSPRYSGVPNERVDTLIYFDTFFHPTLSFETKITMEISTFHFGTSMIIKGVIFQNFRLIFVGPMRGEW